MNLPTGKMAFYGRKVMHLCDHFKVGFLHLILRMRYIIPGACYIPLNDGLLWEDTTVIQTKSLSTTEYTC